MPLQTVQTLDTANATQATVKHVEGEKMECWASMFRVRQPFTATCGFCSKRSCVKKLQQVATLVTAVYVTKGMMI